MSQSYFTIDDIVAAIFDKPSNDAPYPPLAPTLHALIKQGLRRDLASTLMTYTILCAQEALPILLQSAAYKANKIPAPALSIRPSADEYLGVRIKARGKNADLLNNPEILLQLRDHFKTIYLQDLHNSNPEFFKKQNTSRVPSVLGKPRI